MKNYNPIWYKLTKLLKGKRMINTGLTIPYIFGAYKLLGHPFDNIPELLDELRKHPIDKYPIIQKCGTINQHVIAVEEKKIYHKDYLKDVKLRNSNNEIDLIVSSNTDLGKTEETVYKKLTQLYNEPIGVEKFSWNNKEQKWMPFEKEEEDLILSIKK
ncbi:hypothetical protein [Runella sp. SP2]|uniref:hypothetical protein n=1 Tax=Runella sp. SP2 TaxID=2268026 RepID=UPI000F091025|nr:hypothetical protein [Runella sp. SP2]AYQ32042.1 hypothetical protein DTQ70_07585 [Runella sp. SP2]